MALSWGVNFVLKDAIKYCAHVCILKLTFQWFLAPSMPPKRDVSTKSLPWLPGTDLRLNTETNKSECVVNMCKVITDNARGHDNHLLARYKEFRRRQGRMSYLSSSVMIDQLPSN